MPGSTEKKKKSDQQGVSSRVRPFHCSSVGLTPAITPNVGNSTVQFLVVGTCVRASPLTIVQSIQPTLAKSHKHFLKKAAPCAFLITHNRDRLSYKDLSLFALPLSALTSLVVCLGNVALNKMIPNRAIIIIAQRPRLQNAYFVSLC